MRQSKDQNLGRGGDCTGIAAMAVAGEEDEVGGHRYKRLKMEAEAEAPLLPGLPDDLAQLCLRRLPATLLYSLSRSWRRLLYSPTFPPFLSLYALLFPSPESHHQSPPELGFYAYDPLSTTWAALPSLRRRPNITHRHPAFINRPLPVQSVAVGGKLLLLAASDADLLPALPRPLVFHPAAGQWRLGPPFPSPRRWCAGGALGGSVYVVSGVGAEYSNAVARSVHRWDVAGSLEWEPAAALRDGRFSRDAVEAVGCRGRLCVVNVKGSAAKEGAVYNAGAGRWEEMPKGMLGGWTGPAAAMGEEVMYVVDERTGQLRAYDWEGDCWEAVMQSELLIGAARMAAEGGRVCAVEASGRGIAVADVGKAAAAGKVWRVEAPAGMEVVDVHVLPRVTRPAGNGLASHCV